MRDHVVVYRNNPRFKGVDMYLAASAVEGYSTTSHLTKAQRFSASHAAQAAADMPTLPQPQGGPWRPNAHLAGEAVQAWPDAAMDGVCGAHRVAGCEECRSNVGAWWYADLPAAAVGGRCDELEAHLVDLQRRVKTLESPDVRVEEADRAGDDASPAPPTGQRLKPISGPAKAYEQADRLQHAMEVLETRQLARVLIREVRYAEDDIQFAIKLIESVEKSILDGCVIVRTEADRPGVGSAPGISVDEADRPETKEEDRVLLGGYRAALEQISYILCMPGMPDLIKAVPARVATLVQALEAQQATVRPPTPGAPGLPGGDPPSPGSARAPMPAGPHQTGRQQGTEGSS